MLDLRELANIVGADHVLTDPESLQAYARDTSFVNETRPRCVVRPEDAAGVQAIVKLANETLTPLVPVSSGPHHTRGDTVPGTGGAVIVDLRRMNKVVTVDRLRRVAMVEAGVTFEELIPQAEKAGLRLNMPLLPRKSKSVVASMLEREPVVMPKYQWDISDPLACVGVIFGTGDEFRTGQAAGPGTLDEQWAAGAMQKAPYGPGTASWHRLVQGAQGTMGIVTWASLRCELLPKREEAFMAGSSRLDRLLELSHWLVRLRLANECFILNRAALAAIIAAQRPVECVAIRDSLPQWLLFYSVAGYDYLPEERISYQVNNIAGITGRLGVETVRAVAGISAAELLKAVQQPSVEPGWKLLPKGACHEVFFLTIHDRIEGLVEAMCRLSDGAGYPASDLSIYIQPVVQGTGYHCEFDLFYDPGNPVEKERVRALAMDATRALMARGAFFSRPYGDSAGMIMNRDAAGVAVLGKLKKIFDPNGIMNPGKLCF